MEKREARSLVPEDEALAAALLPAVTIGCGRGSFEPTVVALVTDARTLRATAEGVHKAAGATLKDVLLDVVGTGPGEATSIVVAESEER